MCHPSKGSMAACFFDSYLQTRVSGLCSKPKKEMYVRISRTAEKLSSIKTEIVYRSVIQHGKVWVFTASCSILSVNRFYCRMVELTLQTWTSQHFLAYLEKQWKNQEDKPNVCGVGKRIVHLWRCIWVKSVNYILGFDGFMRWGEKRV